MSVSFENCMMNWRASMVGTRSPWRNRNGESFCSLCGFPADQSVAQTSSKPKSRSKPIRTQSVCPMEGTFQISGENLSGHAILNAMNVLFSAVAYSGSFYDIDLCHEGTPEHKALCAIVDHVRSQAWRFAPLTSPKTTQDGDAVKFRRTLFTLRSERALASLLHHSLTSLGIELTCRQRYFAFALDCMLPWFGTVIGCSAGAHSNAASFKEFEALCPREIGGLVGNFALTTGKSVSWTEVKQLGMPEPDTFYFASSGRYLDHDEAQKMIARTNTGYFEPVPAWGMELRWDGRFKLCVIW